MFRRINIIVISLFYMTVLLTACGGNSNDDSGENTALNVGGRIGSSFTLSSVRKSINPDSAEQRATIAGSFVDTVTAIPVNHPFVSGEWIMKESVSAEIQEDGSFSISLDKTKDWILLLTDSTAANRKDQLVSFAALGDSAGGDSMMLIPASSTVSDIDMGTLDISGDEASDTDSLTENEANFSLNLTELRQIADNDNLLKTIKNIYVNYDPVTEKFYSASVTFCWGLDAFLAKNQFSDPASYSFIGYQPSFNSRNDTTFPYEGVKNKDFIISIVPPAAVTDSNGNTYSSFDNSCVLTETIWSDTSYSVGSNNPPFAFGIDYSYDDDGWIQTGAGGCRFVNILEGWWSIQKDGIEKAAFDLGVCSPIDPATGKPVVFLPSIKINVDSSNIITSFDIKWYIYNPESEGYEEINDISGFQNLMEVSALGIVDLQEPRHEERLGFNPSTDTTIYPEAATWKLVDNPAAAYEVFYITVNYRIYGVDFFLDIRP